MRNLTRREFLIAAGGLTALGAATGIDNVLRRHRDAQAASSSLPKEGLSNPDSPRQGDIMKFTNGTKVVSWKEDIYRLSAWPYLFGTASKGALQPFSHFASDNERQSELERRFQVSKPGRNLYLPANYGDLPFAEIRLENADNIPNNLRQQVNVLGSQVLQLLTVSELNRVKAGEIPIAVNPTGTQSSADKVILKGDLGSPEKVLLALAEGIADYGFTSKNGQPGLAAREIAENYWRLNDLRTGFNAHNDPPNFLVFGPDYTPNIDTNTLYSTSTPVYISIPPQPLPYQTIDREIVSNRRPDGMYAVFLEIRWENINAAPQTGPRLKIS